MAGDDGDGGRIVAVRERYASIARHRVHCRHAGHYFERDACRRQHLGLLAAAAKDEGIAALEANHALAFHRLFQQQRIQLDLGHTARAVVFATIDDFRGRRDEAQEFVVDQTIVNHHLGPLQQFLPAQCQQAGVTGTGSDQANMAGSPGLLLIRV